MRRIVPFAVCLVAFAFSAFAEYASANDVRKADKIAASRQFAMPSMRLVRALMQVESECGVTSANILQIARIYVRDVNRIYGTKFSHRDVTDIGSAVAMTRLYLAYYGRIYELRTGLDCTDEIFARMHNGGPKGYKKWRTKQYWNKVKNVLRRINYRNDNGRTAVEGERSARRTRR